MNTPSTWDIVLSDVRLSTDQKAAANEVLESGWLSMGPRTQDFERAFAASSGIPHTVFVANATAGLILALKACGVGPGDEVIVPSLTFVADANGARVLGAEVVFADTQSVQQPLVSTSDILAAATPRTRAVVVVHYAGAAVDLEPLRELRDRGVKVIDDAAHAVGPANDDGSWHTFSGDVAVFSFFANKNLPTGEGGMVATRSPDVAEHMRLLRSHGMTSGTWDRHNQRASDYDVTDVGWNFRPQELAAALGNAGLATLAEHNQARRRTLALYRDHFAERGVARIIFDPDTATTAHIAVAAVPADRRDDIRGALATARIQTSFHYPPIHRFTAYRDARERPLPNTEAAAGQFVSLPLHPWLSPDDVARVVEVIDTTIAH